MQTYDQPTVNPVSADDSTEASMTQALLSPITDEKDSDQPSSPMTHLPPQTQGRINRTGVIILVGCLETLLLFCIFLIIVGEGIWLARKEISNSPYTIYSLGKQIFSNRDGMKLLYVPAGTFQMGSNNGSENEKPVHKVYLDAYWIDESEVTNKMYSKCVKAGSCKASIAMDDKSFNGDQQPVVGVDWNQAKAYCAWAGRRLPTEAEWEKAARGTDGRVYPWGDQAPDKGLLNYNDNLGKTVDVGSYRDGSSPYGALDMAGNAWEWVADFYWDTYYQDSSARNPTGPAYPDNWDDRLIRGGSWGSNHDYARSAHRGYSFPTDLSRYIGFRCALGRSIEKESGPITRTQLIIP